MYGCTIHQSSPGGSVKLIADLNELYKNCDSAAKVNVFNSTNFAKCK
jgi:hypothetical protein